MRQCSATMLAKLDAKMAEIGDIPEHDSAAVLGTLGAGDRAG